MSKRIAVSLACLLLVLPASLVAHENHEHKVMGTVVNIEQNQLEIEVKDAESLQIHLTPETVYERGTTPATAHDIQVGDRVVAFYVEEKGQKMAKRILLPPAKQAE
jgi:hypothetical protein